MVLFTCLTSGAQTVNSEVPTLPTDPKTNCQIRYYYFPNLQAYFDNLNMVYYYQVNGQWETAEELPTNYGGYSIYNKVRVTINNFDGEKPYELIKVHKKLFPYNAKGRFANATASIN